ISVIATTGAAEGTGVGRALMAHAETRARERGLSLLTLNVFATNARARRFYERAGYAVEMVKSATHVPQGAGARGRAALGAGRGARGAVRCAQGAACPPAAWRRRGRRAQGERRTAHDAPRTAHAAPRPLQSSLE